MHESRKIIETYEVAQSMRARTADHNTGDRLLGIGKEERQDTRGMQLCSLQFYYNKDRFTRDSRKREIMHGFFFANTSLYALDT